MSLGDEARFNRPGTASGNWNWRLQGDLHALDGHFSGLQQLAACYDRGSSGAPQSGTE
jgi:4-alpha-glucanotransferase